MKILQAKRHGESGHSLATVMVISGLLGIMVTGLLQLTSYRQKAQHDRRSWIQAYYHAENALTWAAQKLADCDYEDAPEELAALLGKYSTSDGTLDLPYMLEAVVADDSQFEGAWVTITNHPSGLGNLFEITASAKVAGKVRTLQSVIRENPPGYIFDYEYFLNNWAWWWSPAIYGNGDCRANWHFDLLHDPVLNGSVYANGRVDSQGDPYDPYENPDNPPFAGTAALDPVSYVKAGAPRLDMPNLNDLTYYKKKAQEKGGKLYVGSTLVVDAVQGNTNQPGLYLDGTLKSKPIRIDGPVVIPGDVVIKGYVNGIGTLYVGGNLYIIGDITYVDGPSFSPAPATLSRVEQDAWVASAVEDQKDLVGFAVAESIYGGSVDTAKWLSACYLPVGRGLMEMGSEANLGKDGIAGTADDGIPYLDTDGDGSADSAWYDVDEDGVVDGNYDFVTQISMLTGRAFKILNYPTVAGVPVDLDSLTANKLGNLDGIYYTPHAAAMRLNLRDATFNGTLACRDDAVHFNVGFGGLSGYDGSLTFNYDPRIHSRYSDDPNRYIDLGLPRAKGTRQDSVSEIAPITTGF